MPRFFKKVASFPYALARQPVEGHCFQIWTRRLKESLIWLPPLCEHFSLVRFCTGSDFVPNSYFYKGHKLLWSSLFLIMTSTNLYILYSNEVRTSSFSILMEQGTPDRTASCSIFTPVTTVYLTVPLPNTSIPYSSEKLGESYVILFVSMELGIFFTAITFSGLLSSKHAVILISYTFSGPTCNNSI